MMLSGMLSLSNSNRERMKAGSPNTFLAVSQSGFSPRRTHTACIMSLQVSKSTLLWAHSSPHCLASGLVNGIETEAGTQRL